MARKSRVNVVEQTPATQAFSSVAVYARLSVEDKDCDSLENQIQIIENYINNNPQLKIKERYTDNGFTGRTLERNGFQQMMQDLKSGKINCIVVKDLSRFSRNYIEACEYLEKIFPFMGVRFISVNDNFDSVRDDPTDAIIMLKNLINHEYASDLSRKIISAFKGKRKNGEYLGSSVPYGYKRSMVHKNKLEIDEETAPVIRDIFTWRSEGLSQNKIVLRLNESNIPSPAQLRRDKGLTKAMSCVTYLWSVATIRTILVNQIYIGHLIQGRRKYVTQDGKFRKIIAPESQWDIVENAHEPIINMDLWDKVQNITITRRNAFLENLGKKSSPEETENIYKGLVKCGNCGIAMSRNKEILSSGKATYRFICYVRAQNSNLVCETKPIREDKIHNIVHKAISDEIKQTVDVKAILEDLNKDSEKKKAELARQISNKNRRISQLHVLKMSLIESLAIKRIAEDDFINAKAQFLNEENQLLQEIETLETQINDDTLSIKNKWLTSFQRFMDEKIITREMATTLIQKIIAYCRFSN